MTNLTKKQRAAFEALRDVMKEHDIAFLGTCHDAVKNRLLEQETE